MFQVAVIIDSSCKLSLLLNLLINYGFEVLITSLQYLSPRRVNQGLAWKANLTSNKHTTKDFWSDPFRSNSRSILKLTQCQQSEG
jgi:hypothetical protein